MESFGDARLVEALRRSCLSPEQLVLKKGARIMCTRNNPAKGYVNGSLGMVDDFDVETNMPLVQLQTGRRILMEPETWSADVNGESLAAIRQIPLRLAWAITVHKSQGMSLDAASMDLRDAFAYGQGYVALSRVRTLNGLFLAGMNARALEVDPAVLLYDAVLRERSLAAEEHIGAISIEERAKMAERFVERCGGHQKATMEEVKENNDVWKPTKKVREPKWAPTLALLVNGQSVGEVAKSRARTVGTILTHVAEAYTLGKVPAEVLARLQADAKILTDTVHPVMEEHGHEFLGPLYARLGGHYSYDDLRLAQWLFVVAKGEAIERATS
jgi:hypothetical protein